MKFNLCMNCGSNIVSFKDNKKFQCFNCFHTYYHSLATATAIILENDNKILFLVRNREPKKGMLDLPGGFVEPNESAEDGVCREVLEEVGLKLDKSKIKYFMSAPNEYLYKEVLYKTCDLVYTAILENSDITITDTEEVSEFKWINKSEIDLNKIAFDSLRTAVEIYI